MYTPEHHPNCPAFHSFDMGDSEYEIEEICQCIECTSCRGEGETTQLAISGFSLNESYIACENCLGAGRVMIISEDQEDQQEEDYIWAVD